MPKTLRGLVVAGGLATASLVTWLGLSLTASALNPTDCSGVVGMVLGLNSGGTACRFLVVNDDGSLNVAGTVAPGVTAVTPTDRGGTLTSGATAQNAMGANASRKGGWIQNPCNATEDLFVSTSTTATINGAGNDADLGPCDSFSLTQSGLVDQAAVSVIATTIGHRWIGKETQ